MHQGMELPPAVVIGVEEEGLEEEEQHVREKRRREHAHQVVGELRVQRDEHEREERAEGRGERERDREELRELVGEPVVSLITRLVADRLDQQPRRSGRQGRTPRTGGGAAPPPRWPRGSRRRGSAGTRPRRTALPWPPLPLLLSRLPVPAARGVGSTIAAGARYGSLYSRLVRNVAINTTAPNITRPVTGPSTNSSLRFSTPFILPSPSALVRRLGRRLVRRRRWRRRELSAAAGALAARACRSRWSPRT